MELLYSKRWKKAATCGTQQGLLFSFVGSTGESNTSKETAVLRAMEGTATGARSEEGAAMPGYRNGRSANCFVLGTLHQLLPLMMRY
jgi:hypothetical protein